MEINMIKRVLLAFFLFTGAAYAQTVPPANTEVTPPNWLTFGGVAYDGTRTSIGPYLPTNEFASGNATIPQAVVGATAVPSNSVLVEGHGVAGYATTASSTSAAVGVYGYGGISANGANYAAGFNANVSNCGRPQCAPGQGFDFAQMSNEDDFNVMTKPDGTSPIGSVYGHLVAGAADTQSQGPMVGFEVWAAGLTHTPQIPWKTGFDTAPGAATVGLSLGQKTQSTSPDWSQPLVFHTRNAAGADVTSQIAASPSGGVQVTPASGTFQIAGFGLQITQALSPGSSSSACYVGQIQWEPAYLDVCVASNHWRHVALSDF